MLIKKGLKVRTKSCKWCKKRFTPTYSTLQLVCSKKCAFAYVRKINDKKDKVKIRKIKDSLLTHSDYEEKLQKIVNAIARKIDEHYPCISSGRTTGKMNGGHYISVAANNSIRFNLHNIHKQSFSDNHFKSSNRDGYDMGLMARYGLKYFDFVKYELTAKYPSVKLSIPELKAAISQARSFLAMLSEMGDALHSYTASGCMELRDMANYQIGIYK